MLSSLSAYATLRNKFVRSAANFTPESSKNKNFVYTARKRYCICRTGSTQLYVHTTPHQYTRFTAPRTCFVSTEEFSAKQSPQPQLICTPHSTVETGFQKWRLRFVAKLSNTLPEQTIESSPYLSHVTSTLCWTACLQTTFSLNRSPNHTFPAVLALVTTCGVCLPLRTNLV